MEEEKKSDVYLTCQNLPGAFKCIGNSQQRDSAPSNVTLKITKKTLRSPALPPWPSVSHSLQYLCTDWSRGISGR